MLDEENQLLPDEKEVQLQDPSSKPQPSKERQSHEQQPADDVRHDDQSQQEEPAAVGGEEKTPEMTGSKIKSSSFQMGLLTILMVIGVIVGIAGGLIARKHVKHLTKRQLMYVSFPGDILLRLLRQAVLPLVTASIVAAIGVVDIRLAGRMGKIAVMYFTASTIVAEIVGIVLVASIRPGETSTGDSGDQPAERPRVFLIADAILDIIRNLVPPNIVEACLYTWATKITMPQEFNSSDPGNWTAETAEFVVDRVQGTNILGLLTSAMVLGSILAAHSQRSAPLIEVFVALSDAMLVFIRILMWYAPVGICFLIAHRILATPNLGEALVQMGMYIITVLVGLSLHALVTLPTFYILLVGPRTLCKFFGAMVTPAMTAFGTSSSSATIPATITALEDRMGLDPRVVRFMIPIGATVNMDGAALYEAVSAIFIAQRRGMELDAGRILAISLTATLASVGAAGIPGGGLTTMVLVLESVGLPAEDVSIIATVDWFLDRFRTVVNVMGDAVGSSVVNAICIKELEKHHQK
ncbi:excitatory amino acid transporter 3-like [Ornithodoros turicata]|uniref:excitatory amino acid transporter 3-like n=1 Tax=Ornithodoros turicata TaxID=34597 RepID=UPI00313A354F